MYGANPAERVGRIRHPDLVTCDRCHEQEDEAYAESSDTQTLCRGCAGELVRCRACLGMTEFMNLDANGLCGECEPPRGWADPEVRDAR